MTAIRHAALAMTVAIALLANVLLPWVFWNFEDSKVLELLALVAAGALVAEVCLLAIWGALGSQPVVVRLPVTLALLVIGACSYVVGLQWPNMTIPGAELPLEVAGLLGCASLLMFLSVQLPLGIARIARKRYVDLPHEASGGVESARFGVAYLMAVTALVALLIVGVKQALPGVGNGGMFVPQLYRVLLGMLLFAVLSALICVPCVRVTLRPDLDHGALACLFVVFLFGPPTVLGIIHLAIDRITDWLESLAMTYSFCLGLTGTILAVLSGARLLGYRLIDGRKLDADALEHDDGRNVPEGDQGRRAPATRRRQAMMFLLVGACALGLLAGSWPLYETRRQRHVVQSLRFQGVKLGNVFVHDSPRITDFRHITAARVTNPVFADWRTLRQLRRLSSLDLEGSATDEFAFLQSFTRLRILNLRRTAIIDLGCLSRSARIESLNLSETRVTDLVPLSELNELRTLYLDGTQVVDLRPIGGLPRLAWIDISGSQVTDIQPLSGLHALRYLDMSETRVTDLTPIAELPSLEELNLAGSSVADVSQLAELKSLRRLDLTDTRVTDLSPLRGLRLERLKLCDTRIDQKQVDALLVVSPNCLIDR